MPLGDQFLENSPTNGCRNQQVRQGEMECIAEPIAQSVEETQSGNQR